MLCRASRPLRADQSIQLSTQRNNWGIVEPRTSAEKAPAFAVVGGRQSTRRGGAAYSSPSGWVKKECLSASAAVMRVAGVGSRHLHARQEGQARAGSSVREQQNKRLFFLPSRMLSAFSIILASHRDEKGILGYRLSRSYRGSFSPAVSSAGDAAPSPSSRSSSHSSCHDMRGGGVAEQRQSRTRCSSIARVCGVWGMSGLAFPLHGNWLHDQLDAD
jgi:hypothetical protein